MLWGGWEKGGVCYGSRGEGGGIGDARLQAYEWWVGEVR